MRTTAAGRWTTGLALALLAWPSPIAAYEVETHRDLSARAAALSTLDGVLRDSLDQPAGLSTVVKGLPLRDWIGEGAMREDAWFDGVALRFLRHFHDPTRQWSEAGLRFPVGPVMPSSVVWAQDPSQWWSWPQVRRYYFNALTGGTEEARAGALADTFRGLGQLIHLVQDLASPAHVRNDPHVAYNYEKFVYDVQASEPGEFARWLGAPPPEVGSVRPPEAWASLEPHPLAPIPIARLFDADRYGGLDPDVTVEPLIGLAEYTNANFLSEDRGFPDPSGAHPFQFPALSSTAVETRKVKLANGQEVARPYYIKVRHGATDYRLATVSFLRDYASKIPLDPNRAHEAPALDEMVYRDYAVRLLPRALGYSTALLDYFFRGKLELAFDPDPADPGRSRLTVRNGSDEPLGAGGLVVLHRTDEATGGRTPLVAAEVAAEVPTGGEAARFSVDASLEGAALVAVYRGPLGREADAVIGQVQGGAQVEQIFRGAADWMLRTPEGIFPLGVGLGPSQVKWGDRDNTFVTQTFVVIDGHTDQIFQAYEIRRPEGARTVPRRPDGKVDAVPVGGPVRLGGPPIPLGTTMTYERSVEYSQQLVLVDDAGSETLFFGPTVYSVSATFPLTVALPIPSETLHFWSLLDFHLTRDGEVVALVRVDLTGPPGFRAPLHRHRDGTDELIEDTETAAAPIIDFLPPFTDASFFIVNLTRRSVIAKSCEDRVRVSFRTMKQVAWLETRDPVHGTYSRELPGGASSQPSVADYEVRDGVVDLTYPGLYRPELVAVGFTEPQVVRTVFTSQRALGETRSVTQTAVFGNLRATFLQPDEIRRADSRDEGYLILARRGGAPVPVRWQPRAAAAQRFGALVPPAEESFVVLADANRSAALFRVTAFTPTRVRQAHLVTARETFVFPESFLTEFDLLEPGLLYGRRDLRFHRLAAGAEALPGPRPLAAGGPLAGEYHVVGRR